MHNDPVLSMIGIAAKSGNVVSGEFSTEKAVKTGHAYLVIVFTEARKHLDAVSEKNSVHHLP